jgi:uncharacterized protein YdcH (DUF465 family)
MSRAKSRQHWRFYSLDGVSPESTLGLVKLFHTCKAACKQALYGGFMDFLQPDVQDKLMKEHFEFRKLMEEHRAADERLMYLRNKIRLSAQETVEEVELKKAKLRAKERITRSCRNSKGGASEALKNSGLVLNE